jgi:S1-C subfamily serine protease
VSEVTPDGPADKAGIEGGEEEEIEGISVPTGDVVTGVEEKTITSPDEVIETVNSSKPGERLDLTVVTPGEKPRRVEVTVGVRPDDS